jgi:4-amino-4-deoxy-L-arabinose transferase-like glycosyltransferase
MDLAYRISEEEYLRAAKATVQASRWRIAVGILITTAMAIGGIWLLLIHQWISGTIWVVVAVAPWLIARWRIRSSAMRSYRTSSFLHGEIRTHIDELGTSFIYPNDNSNSTWQLYRDFIETEEMYILMVSSSLCRFIPRKAFSPEQRSEFEHLISAHIKKVS